MENASKALLMAAGTLIGILILSLAVYLFVSFGNTSAQVHKQNEENQLNQFNTQFTSYEGKDITIYDVVTIANLATENNIYYEFEKRGYHADGKDTYISVHLEDKNWIEKGYNHTGDTIYDNLIAEDLKNMNTDDGTLQKYKCKVYISNITERVYRVDIKKK